MLHVDLRCRTYSLESVDHAADAPWPRGIRPEIDILRIEFVDRLLSADLGMGHDIGRREAYDGDIPRAEDLCRKTARTGAEADSDYGRERAVAFRIDYRAVYLERFTVNADGYGQGIVSHRHLRHHAAEAREFRDDRVVGVAEFGRYA